MWEDCVKWFIEQLRQFEKEAMGVSYDYKHREWNAALEYDFRMETHCHICKERLAPDYSDRVRDI